MSITTQPPTTPMTIDNVITALNYISGTSSIQQQSPHLIKEAETVLLSWENQNPDEYARIILSILLPVRSAASTAPSIKDVPSPLSPAAILTSMKEESAVPRLAAILALKAAVTRRWKDRGRRRRRSHRSPSGSTGHPQQQNEAWSSSVFDHDDYSLLSEQTKERIRTVILSVVTNGGLDSQSIDTKCHEVAGQISQDRNLQSAASSLLSKIARFDLPVSFQKLIPALIAHATKHVTASTLSSSSYPPDQRQQPNYDYYADEQMDMVVRLNSSYALELILSELCTKRLLIDKKYVASIAKNHLLTLVEGGFFPAIHFVGEQLSKSTDNNNNNNNNKKAPVDDVGIVKYAVLMTKILHHLLVSALPSLTGNSFSTEDESSGVATLAVVDRAFTIILNCIPPFLLQLRGKQSHSLECIQPQQKEDTELDGLLMELFEELCDIPVVVQHSHPIQFGRYLELFLSLFYTNLMGNTAMTGSIDDVHVVLGLYMKSEQVSLLLHPECFVMSAVKFLSNVISCSYYIPDESTNEGVAALRSETGTNTQKRVITTKGDAHIDTSTLQSVVHTVWNNFLTAERMCSLADMAICRWMVLAPDKLTEWNEDPESYFVSDEQRTAEDDLASAAQNLFCSLVESIPGRTLIGSRVALMLGCVNAQHYAAKVEAGEITGNNGVDAVTGIGDHSILLWDSIYTATGLSSNILEKHANFRFGDWIRSCLGPCLSVLLQGRKESPFLPVLRRRIVWLIGCSAQRITQDCHLYEALVSILSNQTCSQNDVAVKLEAVEAMNSFLYDIGENLEACVTFAEPAVASLYQLVNECTELESQSKILSCVSLILSCIAGSGKPISDAVANAAVGPLTNIWDNAIDQKLLLRREVMSILSSIALLVGKEQAIRLHPIALPIVNNVLDPACASENMFLVENGLSLWLTLVRSAPTYSSQLDAVFIRAQQILERGLEHLKSIMMVAEGYILLGESQFLNSHNQTLCDILSLVVGRVSPRGAAYVALVLEALLRSFPVEGGFLLLHGGIFRTMLKSCAANYHNDNTCEPDRVIALYLATFARALLGSSHLLDPCFPVSIGESGNMQFEPRDLVKMFFKTFDSSLYATHGLLGKKLWGLLLISLLPSKNGYTIFSQYILESMDDLMSLCLDFLVSEKQEKLLPYSVGYDSDDEGIDAGKDLYDAQLSGAVMKDVVQTTDFKSFFRSTLNDLSCVIGMEAYQNAIDSVEPATRQRLETILSSS